MKKITHPLLLASLISIASLSAQAAETSRLFFEQTGYTLKDDTISLDLEYVFDSAGFATGVRAGAFGGEVILNTASDAVSGFDYSSVGYKRSLQKGFSAYGIVSYYDDEVTAVSATDFAIGAAYTLDMNALSLNINPELVTDDSGALRGGKNTVFIKSSAKFDIKNTGAALVAEVILENNTFLDTVINFGARLQPKKNLTIDLVLYSDRGDIGPTPGTTKAIPGYVIVNLLF